MRGCSLLGCTLLLVSCATPSEPVELPANTPLQLRVWAEVSPAQVSLRDSDAVVRVRLIARNPGDTTLRIVSGGPPYWFAGDPGQSAGMSHAFRIGTDLEPLHAGPSTDYFGDFVYVFAAHQSRRVDATIRIRDWRAGSWPLVAGRYYVRSYFNGREGASAMLTFVP